MVVAHYIEGSVSQCQSASQCVSVSVCPSCQSVSVSASISELVCVRQWQCPLCGRHMFRYGPRFHGHKSQVYVPRLTGRVKVTTRTTRAEE